MFATLLLWALLWFPGHACLRRLGWDEPESGLLGVLCRGYAASLALLGGLSVVCYLSHAPLGLFSAALALLVLGGLVLALRDRAGLRFAFDRFEWVGVGLLALHLLASARVGGWLDGDATFHVAHVRRLLEHGFDNRDVYLREPFFHHIYHTNLLYAVHASLTQLAGQDFLQSWFHTLPWAKLVSFAAHGYLGYRIASRRWVGWLTALLAEIARAPESYTLYPNGVAAGFLLPAALAVGLGGPLRSGGRRTAWELAALCFVMGQVHAMYAIYAGILLGASLGLRLLLGSASVRRALVPCLFALLAGAPFVLVSRYAFLPDAAELAAALREDPPLPAPPPAALDATASEPRPLVVGGNLEKQLRRLPDGRHVMDPEQMGGIVPLLLGLCALSLCLWWDRPRRLDWLGLAAPVILICGMLFVPALATLSVALLQEGFVVARLATILASLLCVGVAGALVCLLQRAPSPAITGAASLLAAALLGAMLPGQAPRAFTEHVRSALSGQSEARAQLREHEVRRRLLVDHVPPGSTILTTPRMARYVVMIFDAHVIAADRSHTHVPGIERRRREASLLTARRTDPALRAALLRKYRIRWVAYRDKRRSWHAWAERAGNHVGEAGGMHLSDLGPRYEGAP